MARETWLDCVARRAVLPPVVVERVLAAALEVGLDPRTSPSGEFAAALRAALDAARERERAMAAELAQRAERARAIGA